MTLAQARPSASCLRPPDKRAVRFTELTLQNLKKHPLVEVVGSFDASKHAISCKSEDGRLKAVVMSPPTFLDWEGKGINAHEREFSGNKPNRFFATIQHFGLVRRMLEYGVKVILIKPSEKAPEGVFVRDIMFAIDDKLFQSSLLRPERKTEEAQVSGGIKPPKEAIIEGGNVILGKDVVFLGVGDRTNYAAAEWLQYTLGTSREVIPLKLKETVPGKVDGILHLDCVFCPVEERNGSPGAAILYPQGFENAADVGLLNKMYGRIETVSSAEYGLLGPNVLKLDKNTAIASPQANGVAETLVQLGMKVMKYGYDEIIKGGGAYRCTYAAIEREN